MKALRFHRKRRDRSATPRLNRTNRCKPFANHDLFIFAVIYDRTDYKPSGTYYSVAHSIRKLPFTEQHRSQLSWRPNTICSVALADFGKFPIFAESAWSTSSSQRAGGHAAQCEGAPGLGSETWNNTGLNFEPLVLLASVDTESPNHSQTLITLKSAALYLSWSPVREMERSRRRGENE